jgi:hypothetical protein
VGEGREWRKRRVGEWESGRGEELGKFFLFLLPSSLFLLPSSFYIC